MRKSPDPFPMAVLFLPNTQSQFTPWQLHHDMGFPRLPRGEALYRIPFYFVILAEAGIHPKP